MALLITLGLGAVGCQQDKATGTVARPAMAACPVCSASAPVGTYCPKCKAVAVVDAKTYQCKGCEKEVTEGTWCAKHNKFRFQNAEMTCPNSGKTVTRGAYCEKCNGYHGLPLVKYDAQKEQPFPVIK